MALISGYLGLLTGIPAGTAGNPVTELAVPGYARQPASFGTPRDGIAKLATSYTFGCISAGPIAGRALYLSATATMPAFVIPFGTGPRTLPTIGPSDAGDVGSITLILTAMQGTLDGAAFSGALCNGQASAVAGSCYDAWDESQAPWGTQRASDGTLAKAIPMGTLMFPVYGWETVIAGRVVPLQALVEPPAVR